MELRLVLDNIRSTYNVGAILRTAEGFGVKQVILSGYTPATKYTEMAPALPHILEKTTTQIAKTALGAERLVKCEWSEEISGMLEQLKSEGYVIFGLENNLGRNEEERLVELRDWRKGFVTKRSNKAESKSETKKLETEKMVLILGEEVKGIDHSLFALIDKFLEIPMVGQKESFNVSVAAGIALYELLARK